MPDFALEQDCGGLVCGIDEAGRGPLAGPVVAAAVILERRRLPRALRHGLDDSKQLAPERRAELYGLLLSLAAGGHAAIGVGASSAIEIDHFNILRGTFRAMGRALSALTALGRAPDAALVDGNMPPPLPCRVVTAIEGDGRSLSIAAASIVAKVTRDRLMGALAPRYPVYGWATNVGYSTAEHLEALGMHGPTPHHRRSFAPVAQYLQGELLSDATYSV
jgi:ribonuclease HII